MTTSDRVQLFDIGANLTDSMFQGSYRGKQYHKADLDAVLERAWETNVAHVIVTAGSLPECDEAHELSEKDARLYCTVGVHPTRCSEFLDASTTPEQHIEALKSAIDKAGDKVKAIGEFGLDYDRLQFCDKETQKRFFELQLVELTKHAPHLSCFFHMREACDDFIDIVGRNRGSFRKGVVHSFTGTADEARRLIELDLYIGINGCSMKTSANLDVVKSLPSDRILIETDSPWCDIRSTHAGAEFVKTKWQAKPQKRWQAGMCVKNRTEPCHVRQTLEVVAGARGEDVEAFGRQVFETSVDVFLGGQA